jgi:glycosidase/MoaA/NifB/PqqE/SkfB family radical SAM enzyme
VRKLRSSVPGWWRDAVVYSIFVDRFRRGGGDGAWANPGRSDREHYAGGDLHGVREALPYLSELGVDVLHLTPICPAQSPHRYDSVAPRAVEPELGGEDALRALVSEARSRGMRVVLDLTVTHVNREFFAFRDVEARGEASAYWDWFHVYSFPFGEGLRPGYLHYQKGQWREPLLRTDNPEVADYLVGTFRHWAPLVDGFRVDAAADVEPELVRRIRRAVRSANPDAVVFGEVVTANLHRWIASGLDAATDFSLQSATTRWLTEPGGGADLMARYGQRRFERPGPGWATINFTSTHDQPRLGTACGDPRVARLGQLLVLTSETVPMIYYGDEVGLCSDAGERNFEDVWPDRQPMPWSEDAWDHETLELVRAAIALRRGSEVLRRGDQRPLDLPGANDDVVAFRRSLGGRCVDLILNGGSQPCAVEIEAGEREVALVSGDVEVRGELVELGPWSAVVLDRAPVHQDLLEHNAALAVAAFERGEVVTPAYPTQLDITVTELCNLRCRHCITEAPSKTREGRARDIRPWVLDALGEALQAVDYVSFSHGGESLVSGVFPRVLAAIARAQRGREHRADVHLVSNGMLLDVRTVAELVEHGVNSFMVSVDGATAERNDSIRVGSSLDTVVANLRGLARMRDREGADIRVGISSVVCRSNLAELERLAQLAVKLGVDWLKVEEMYPVNGFARAELLRPRDVEVRAAVDGIAGMLDQAGVVLVDHLETPAGCGCARCAGDDEAARRFRQADDFANRREIVPCRAAWERAVIDPDGTVRPVDYAHPALGSLREASMLELWNGPVAQRIRGDALARML